MEASLMTISTGHIVRRRADTKPVRVCVKDLVGSAEDIANATFQLTVGTEPCPTASGTELFTVVGVIYGPAADGIVDFAITGGNEVHVGFYYFEVEMIDSAGLVDTIIFGWYEVKQDKTKGNPGQIWTPSGVTDERWTDWEDASGPFRGWMDCADDTKNWWEYQVRDGVPVVRWSGANTGAWLTLEFAGAQAVGGTWGPTGVWEFTGLMYWAPGCRLLLLSNFYDVCLTLMSVASDRMRLECESYHPYGYDDYYENTNFFHTARTEDEWVAYRWRMDCDTPQVSGKIWYPADPVNWEADEPEAWNGQVGLLTAPLRTVLPVRFQFQDGSAATICDIARIAWERVG